MTIKRRNRKDKCYHGQYKELKLGQVHSDPSKNNDRNSGNDDRL